MKRSYSSYTQHGSVKFTRINAKLLFSNANNCQQKTQSVITLPGSVDFLRWPSLHLTLVSVGFAACTSTAACSFSTRSTELATNISQLLYHLATTSTNYSQSPASLHCPLLLHIMYSTVGVWLSPKMLVFINVVTLSAQLILGCNHLWVYQPFPWVTSHPRQFITGVSYHRSLQQANHTVHWPHICRITA